MELTALNVYWFLSVGLVVGLFSFYTFGKRGLRMRPSIIMGALGSVTTGCFAAWFNVGALNIFALFGAIGFLFLANAFRTTEKPLFIDTQ